MPIDVYSPIGICCVVDLIQIYECFCDRTRLRILNLLGTGPLCVCHLQEILEAEQVKISKHLRYLKTHGLVEVSKEGNWRIYSLASNPAKTLAANLACLQDCAREDKAFGEDLANLKKLRGKIAGNAPLCCAKTEHSKPKASCC